MASSRGDELDAPAVKYPIFEHGEDLLIVVRQDGLFEFRSESSGGSIKADNTVHLKDVI